jgi:hypothetical protein
MIDYTERRHDDDGRNELKEKQNKNCEVEKKINVKRKMNEKYKSN